MLGELPKLFGKSFAIGFFLPATTLGLLLVGIATAFGYAGVLLPLLKEKELWGVVSAVLGVWLLAVMLMALNIPIYQLLEGYYTPFLWRMADQRREFERLTKSAKDLGNNGQALWALAERFPDQLEYVLPTKFGNRLRAFEVYSRVIYGIEGIQGWSRLMGVIPSEYRQSIEDAKAVVDFWVNLWASAIIAVIAYAAFAAVMRTVPAPWIPLVCVVGAWASAYAGRIAASDWAEFGMGAFDLFRQDLAKKLGLKIPASIEEERRMWTLVSQMWVYRSREAADWLAPYRAAESGRGSGEKSCTTATVAKVV